MFSTRETRPADVGRDLDRLRADVARLGNTVTALVRSQSDSANSAVRDAAEQARDRVYARASDLGRSGQALAYEARDRLSHANASLEGQIERNPIMAVLVAAGIGLVLGLVSRHRS